MPYKNAELLIAGMKELPDYTLHLLSKISPERRVELEKRIPEGAHVKFWNGVSEEDYQKLLASSWALATASRDEGFGLPIIEAMALGVPVVCSDTEIFREVGESAALYFSADSPAGFAQQIKHLEDQKLRQDHIEKGKKQAARFNWRASAQALLDLINRI